MNHPLSVVQLNTVFNGGGVDNQTLELTAGLRDLGVKVGMAVAVDSRWESRAHALQVPVATFPARSPLKWRTIMGVRSVIREMRADILHIHQGRDYWPGIIGALLAGCGTRVVITRHLMTRPRGFSRKFLLRMARVVAVSKAVEKVIRTELMGDSKRIFQAYCGFDVSRYLQVAPTAARGIREREGWRPEHVVFGVVGMYDLPRGKGQVEFIEAAAAVHQNFPNTRFALIGQGSMRPLLQERIAATGLDQVVKLIPFTDDILPLEAALDVLVHPAVGTDAFPLVVLEGMISGKPVIASAIDGIVEQFQEGVQGFFVPRGDVSALAAAMSRLAGDAGLRERMGAAGRAHVATHFTRVRLAQNTLDIYQGIL